MKLVNVRVVLISIIGLVLIPSANLIAGELTEDTTWSGTVTVDSNVVVPAGIVLTIEPGTTVRIKDANSIFVYGQLLADGTETQPIRFTRYASGMTWKQIRFVEAADSRLTNCIFEYASCVGDHKDYYNPGPKRYLYHEAVVLVASHVDFEKCVFQNLPSAGGAGDAIAIFSDDPNHPGNASANFRSCRFLSIGQGIHTRYSYVLVEDCYFVGKTGDNDDVDLYGESTPPCLIRRNLFDAPCYDDRVHPTKCSAIITENIIIGDTNHGDHGIVLRDKSTPIVTNNVIYNCPNGGIAVENTCTAILVNNTIVNCTKGIHCFDLGRAGFPYYLTPGGGTATVINCIIWDCSPSILIEDSPNTQAKDRGSHITVNYCDVKGGRASVTVSGIYSTVTWGADNNNVDPQFVNAGSKDYHLKSQAGRWNPTTQTWVRDIIHSFPCIDKGDPNSDWTAELWPNGKRINMGAYGGTPQASMSLSNVGNIADLNNDGLVNYMDLLLFTNQWSAEQFLLSEDLNRNGFVDFSDFAIFSQQWSDTLAAEPSMTFRIGDCNQELSGVFVAGESSETRFSVWVEDRYIHFEDLMYANCCPNELGLEKEINDSQITLYEIGYGGLCDCMCYFPITATLGPFEDGTYTVEVFDNYGKSLGVVEVTISETIEPSITYQIEDCNQEASGLFAAEQSSQTRFTATVKGNNIYFKDMMVANCCATELWLEMTVEGNLITICENEEGGFCFCICNYPVTATLGPFEPGTYILDVYEDYGGFIGTTVVTIGASQ